MLRDADPLPLVRRARLQRVPLRRRRRQAAAGAGRSAAESADLKAWHDHVFLFDNPKGPHKEYWQHVQGCRHWLVLQRNTATNTVMNAWPARDVALKRGRR